jgi:hypothetical protein
MSVPPLFLAMALLYQNREYSLDQQGDLYLARRGAYLPSKSIADPFFSVYLRAPVRWTETLIESIALPLPYL